MAVIPEYSEVKLSRTIQCSNSKSLSWQANLYFQEKSWL